MNTQKKHNLRPKTNWLWIKDDFRTQQQATSIEIPYRFLSKCLDSQNHNKELSFLYKPSLIPMTKEDSTLRNAFFFLSDAMESKLGLKITSKITVDSYYQFPEMLFYVNTISPPNFSIFSKVCNYLTNKKIKVNVNYTLVIPKTEEADICTNSFCLCEKCQPEISDTLNSLGIFESSSTNTLNSDNTDIENESLKKIRKFTIIDGGKK